MGFGLGLGLGSISKLCSSSPQTHNEATYLLGGDAERAVCDLLLMVVVMVVVVATVLYLP